MEAGTDGARFIEEAEPLPGEIVLAPRQGFSSFWSGSIQEPLKRLGAKTIYLAGMLAEGCVESHARDAVENGYSPVVVSEAIASISPELLEAALCTLALHTSAVVTLGEAVESWQAPVVQSRA